MFCRADKGDSIKASYLHHLSKLNGAAVVGEVEVARKFSTNKNTLTVGGSYMVDPHTTFKARLNNHGNLRALLQHQLSPKNLTQESKVWVITVPHTLSRYIDL